MLGAAQKTALLEALEKALPVEKAAEKTRLAHQRPLTNQQLSRTLLFMPVAKQYRTWHLRTYTGKQLALLSGRTQAYSYRTTERFLSEVAAAGGSESLTDGLAGWTYGLWQGQFEPAQKPGHAQPAIFYVDGHHKAVYTDKLIPRGLVGRLGKVLGCRGLVLLHDTQGHPLLALTSRGDKHLTKGLPEVVERFEQAVGNSFKIKRLVVDREVMSGEFLASELENRRVIVTILKENQYQGLDTFKEVGAFVPWLYDKREKERLVREVAPATLDLKVTSPLSGQPVRLKVALIRDRRRQKQTGPAKVEAKLIPIVTSSLETEVTPLSPNEAVAMAAAYRKRWPVQENVIKDWLVAMGLDVNHGFAKTEVENSEVARKREKLQQRLAVAIKRAASATERSKQASALHRRRNQQLKELGPKVNLKIQKLYDQLEATNSSSTYQQKAQCKQAEQQLVAPVERLKDLEWAAWSKCKQEYQKAQEYEGEQKKLQTQLDKLNAMERQMQELDDRKDQVMTVFKLALANLGMWVRDHLFPASYAHCSWQRLRPFFELGGWVSEGALVVKVTLEPFNDWALNRDLEKVCELVNEAGLILADGRLLKLGLAAAQKGVPKKAEPGKIGGDVGENLSTYPVSFYSSISKTG